MDAIASVGLGSLRRALVVVLTMSVIIGGTEMRWAPPSSAATPPLVIGQACAQDVTRDGIGGAVTEASVQCVAGLASKTRGYLKRDCVLGSKALAQGATYYVDECKGKSTLQAEAVAQARVVAQLNAKGVYGERGPSGSIAPNLQWETVLKGGKRADLLLYDRSAASGPIGLVEIKGSWNGSTAETRAASQVVQYVQDNSSRFGSRPVVPYTFTAPGFHDTFMIDRCDRAKHAYVDTYTTSSTAADGVLVVSRSRADCSGNQESDEQVHLEEQNLGVTVEVGQDADGNGNDDLFDALIQYAADHDLADVVHLLPTSVRVTFANPLKIHLGPSQVEHLIDVLAAGATEAVARNLLEGIQAAAAGDTAALNGALGVGGSSSLDAELIALTESQPELVQEAAQIVNAVRNGEVVSSADLSAASEEIAAAVSEQTGTTTAVLEPEVETALLDIATGELPELALEDAAMTALDAELVEGIVTAELLVDGGIAIGAVAAGAAVVLIAAAAIVGVWWLSAHWNAWGDPHLATLDGLSYDLQAAGEFHLVRVPSRGIDVQARFSPISDNVSSVRAVAFQLGDTWVQLTSRGGATVDGEPWEANVNHLDFPDGSALWRQGSYYVASFGGDAPVTLTYKGMNLTVDVPPGVPTTGLLGDNDGQAGNDLRLADGSALADTSASTLDGPYADSWRLTDADTLFWYGAGESTSMYTDRAFPANVVKLSDFSASTQDAAAATCTAEGVPPGPQFQACMLDVIITGDASSRRARPPPPTC